MKNRPVCHGKPMMKAGSSWSGKTKVPVFRCNVCGRRTSKKEKGDANTVGSN